MTIPVSKFLRGFMLRQFELAYNYVPTTQYRSPRKRKNGFISVSNRRGAGQATSFPFFPCRSTDGIAGRPFITYYRKHCAFSYSFENHLFDVLNPMPRLGSEGKAFLQGWVNLSRRSNFYWDQRNELRTPLRSCTLCVSPVFPAQSGLL